MAKCLPRVCALCWVLAAGPAWAEDEQVAAKAQAAEVVTLAKLAPLLCSTIEVDDHAVQDLLTHAEISEQDIVDPKVFGAQDQRVAQNFAQSFKDNGAQTCEDVFTFLGPEGVKMLRRKAGAPG